MAGWRTAREILAQTRPDVIRQIHESFLAAGCDAVETNTFGANKIVLNEFGIADQAFELNQRACEIAREACRKFATPEQAAVCDRLDRAGHALADAGAYHVDVLVDSYAEQVRGLIAGGRRCAADRDAAGPADGQGGAQCGDAR